MTPEREVVSALCESGAVRAVDRVVDLVLTAGRSSFAVCAAVTQFNRLTASPPLAPRAQAGVAIIVAMVVHVMLEWLDGGPAGWMWLLVPVFVLAAGTVLAVTGRAGRSRESQPRT